MLLRALGAALLLFRGASALNLMASMQEPMLNLPEYEEFFAPVMNHTNIVASPYHSADNPAPPVVFMHGMGDSGSNRGMKSICASVTKKYPGTYSKCLTVADGSASIFTVLDKQLDELVAAIRSDPQLANGFNAVGLSQGNVLLKSYIVRYNDPPVRKFISMCGPLEGVGTCPKNILYQAVCPLWKLDEYGAPIAFSDYWKDSKDKATYLKKSRFLADINNEKDQKNITYKENYSSLTKLVLVEALEDSMVVPKESEQHGFWQWGTKNTVVNMTQYEGYVYDYLGLQTMDKAGKIDTLSFKGDHLRWSSDFWNNQILPYLAD